MKKISFTLILIGSLLTLSGCYRVGCIDPKADNYDEKAKNSDGSCAYTGNVYFWCTPAVSDSLYLEGHEKLYFELEGEIVDSIATVSFATVQGTCSGIGTMTIKRSFVGDTKWNYHYRVKGYNNYTLYEDFIVVKSKDCTEVQLF